MYIAIEGVIGVGKTTLARLLQPAFEAEILLEVFEENPFLSDFYADRDRYAFQTQIFFLLSRYHQQRRGVTAHPGKRGKSLISDYTFAKDSLFARINLKGDELEMYSRVHEALAEKISHARPARLPARQHRHAHAAHRHARPLLRTQHGARLHRRTQPGV